MDDSPAGATTQPPYLTTPAIRQRLDLLSHLLEFGHQMVVVQGEAGSGRSRLLGAIAEQARPNWRVIAGQGANMRTAPALLAALTEALELGELDAGVEDLRARLAEIELGGQLCILALDDAEQLDDAARSMLFSLAYSSHQRGDLRVVMTSDADSDFGERLQAAAPEGAVIHMVDLPPLEPDELKTLALSALPAVGGDLQLDADLQLDEGLDLEQLAQDAAGNPGRMLASLKNGGHKPIHPGQRAAAAARAMGGALRGFEVRKYTAVLAAAAFVLVAVAIGMLLFSRHSENTQPGTVEITLPAPSAEAPPPLDSAPLTASEPASSAAAAPEPAAVAPADAPSLAEPAAESVEPAPMAAEQAPAAPTAAPTAAVAETIPVEAASNEPPPAAVSTPVPAPAPVAVPTPKASTKTETKTPAKTAAKADGDKHPKTAPAKSSAQTAAGAKPATKPAAAASTADEPKSFYSSSWVKRQKPQSFVVQLFGSRERAATARFIREHRIGEKATVVEVKLKGAPWYVVVTGLYTSRSAATSAIRALPAPLLKGKPWPRAVATLK